VVNVECRRFVQVPLPARSTRPSPQYGKIHAARRLGPLRARREVLNAAPRDVSDIL
jgi:hypothetical protein